MTIYSSVIWIVEPKWLEEGSTISGDLSQFTVVVSDQAHSDMHGVSDNIDVGDARVTIKLSE